MEDVPDVVKRRRTEHDGDGEHPEDAAERASGGVSNGTEPELQTESSVHEGNDGPVNNAEDDDVQAEFEASMNVLNTFPGLSRCRSVECYRKLNTIDEGTYGVVYRAEDIDTKEVYALKRVKLDKDNSKDGFPQTALREIHILMSLKHPNIIDVKEMVVGSNLSSIFMVMEYMDHEVKTLLEEMKFPFTQSEVKCLMIQLLEGVKHMHENWIIHRDLKTSNLLLNNRGVLKIADLGLARHYEDPLKPYTQPVVTLWYRAPELLLGQKEYSAAIDMWSVGCIFAELMSREPLFPGEGDIDQLNRIFKELGTPNEEVWPGFNTLPVPKRVTFKNYEYNDLRARFPLHSSISDKPSISENGFDLLCRLLTYDPERRISADEALRHPYFSESPLPKSPDMMPTFAPTHESGDKQKRRERRWKEEELKRQLLGIRK